ncbi:hypothetical protein WQO_34315 (plasmid) [Streptomyces globisporus C-1027]|uniref:Uncharacterized protein n=1 Tax=Streptomyces globisporus C-1027 TaxID=1172567 RepID=A0A0U3DDF2_STRGL|nr:hypothetical protein WQO_34315 [Streptomyces globisporus C-1027]
MVAVAFPGGRGSQLLVPTGGRQHGRAWQSPSVTAEDDDYALVVWMGTHQQVVVALRGIEDRKARTV